MTVIYNGFKIDKGLQLSWEMRRIVASGTTASIVSGSPTSGVDADAASWTGAVQEMVDGDGIVTSQRFTGIAKGTSSETSAAAGIVATWAPVAGLVYRGGAKTASNANTQALIDALIGKKVIFDLTSNLWTVDTAAADALVNCVVIVGGNPKTSEIDFVYSQKGTFWDTSSAK